MNRTTRTHCLRFALLCITLALPAAAQDQGQWRASSSTAKTTTGDVAFSASKISINFTTFTIAQIRSLEPAEALALFNADPGGHGNIYRLNVEASRQFLHKNTLCGSEETDYAITYVTGRELRLAFFSGASIPKLTLDDITNSERLCGTFTYTR